MVKKRSKRAKITLFRCTAGINSCHPYYYRRIRSNWLDLEVEAIMFRTVLAGCRPSETTARTRRWRPFRAKYICIWKSLGVDWQSFMMSVIRDTRMQAMWFACRFSERVSRFPFSISRLTIDRPEPLPRQSIQYSSFVWFFSSFLFPQRKQREKRRLRPQSMRGYQRLFLFVAFSFQPGNRRIRV